MPKLLRIRKGSKVSSKRWKKLTRAAFGCQKPWKERRRGRYVAYYVKHKVAEGHVHNIITDMQQWIAMCLAAAENYAAPIPAVLACVMDVLLVDLDAQTNH